MKNLVKRFGQFINEGEDNSRGFGYSPNVRDNDMLSNRHRDDEFEESGYDDEGNYIKDKMSDAESEKCVGGCYDFDNTGKCIDCGHMDPNYEYEDEDDDHVDPQHKINTTRFNRGQDFADSKIDRQISRHNMGKMSDRELSEAKKQEKIEALDAIDKKFAKMKPAKKSMPMKPMTKKNMEMEEEEEETSMKPKMLFGKPVKSAKPETNKMPLKGGKPAFLSGKK